MDWMSDERRILQVELAGSTHSALATAKFERFERNGEYCMIPWLRIENWISGHNLIEVPLNKVEAIHYAAA